MIANLITSTYTWLQKPLVERTVKTIVEVTAAQAAVYTTLVPNPPPLGASVAISSGAGLVAFGLNLVLAWATKTKSAKLDALAVAIDKVVDERIKEQGLHA